jgi:arylsulfatase
LKITFTQKLFTVAIACGVAAVSLTGLGAPANAAEKKPNIVFILTDNLGYGEIGCYGGGITRGVATPRIDSLARQGLRLLNMNMETQCTPSRASLMTGRWAIRSGCHSVPFGGVADGK